MEMMNCLDNWVLYMCSLCTVHTNYMFRPLAHRGNAVNLEDKTKEIFSSGNWDLFSCKKCYCSVLQIGCISTDMQGVYTRVVHVFIKLHFVHRLSEMVKATHSFIGSLAMEQTWKCMDQTAEIHVEIATLPNTTEYANTKP